MHLYFYLPPAVFLLLSGHIPVYYAAMLVLTWGEVFCTIADGPYVSNRVPASHRGRINSFSSVLSSAVYGVCSLAVGWLRRSGRIMACWVSFWALVTRRFRRRSTSLTTASRVTSARPATRMA